MRRKVSRGIFMASTGPEAMTVADAPLSPSNPRSPTTVRPSAASIRARSRSPWPGTLFLTSTLPEVRTNKLPGSLPSSMSVSPGPKDAGSEPSANSSRSSSVRNSKNLTPFSPSSTIPPMPGTFPCTDYMPAPTPTKHAPADTPSRALQKGTGTAFCAVSVLRGAGGEGLRRLAGRESAFLWGPSVAFDVGLERRELAVGGALGSSGHRAARREPDEGLRDPEGLPVIAAPLVEGREPLVGVAADEASSDARLVEADGLLGVAALLGPRSLLVALHRGLEAAHGVFFRPDPLPLGTVEAEERRRLPGRPGSRPKMSRNRLRTNPGVSSGRVCSKT